MASLDHSLYFHVGGSELRADEWLLHVMASEWAGGGRGLTRGQFYDRSGRLVVSVVQEGLIRLRIAGQVQWQQSSDSNTAAAAAAAGSSEQSTSRRDKKAKASKQAANEKVVQGEAIANSDGGSSGEKKLSPSNHFTVLPAKL